MTAEYAIKKGLYVNALVGIDIDNNFDEYTYHVPDGELYYVRQDRRLYLTEGESGIRQLDIEYLTKFHENVYARFHAGILEWMYGGVGGEVRAGSDLSIQGVRTERSGAETTDDSRGDERGGGRGRVDRGV